MSILRGSQKSRWTPVLIGAVIGVCLAGGWRYQQHRASARQVPEAGSYYD
jgi:hypothetical protein